MNMALSIFAGFCLGMLLNYFWMPQIIICGAVAIVSTVTPLTSPAAAVTTSAKISAANTPSAILPPLPGFLFVFLLVAMAELLIFTKLSQQLDDRRHNVELL